MGFCELGAFATYDGTSHRAGLTWRWHLAECCCQLAVPGDSAEALPARVLKVLEVQRLGLQVLKCSRAKHVCVSSSAQMCNVYIAIIICHTQLHLHLPAFRQARSCS